MMLKFEAAVGVLFLVQTGVLSAQVQVSDQNRMQNPTSNGSGSLVATGKVVGPDEKPLAGVPVQVQGPQGKTFAVTDPSGSWFLYNLPPGKYEVAPAAGMGTSSTGPITFSVKDPGLFDKLVGAEPKAYIATEMKLDKFNQ
jgi:hypothetical protein